MELFTAAEALTDHHWELNGILESVESAAMNCEIAAIAAQMNTREVRLALIRYRQAQNQLAQQLQKCALVPSTAP